MRRHHMPFHLACVAIVLFLLFASAGSAGSAGPAGSAGSAGPAGSATAAPEAEFVGSDPKETTSRSGFVPPQPASKRRTSRLHVYNRTLDPSWIEGESRFWYRRELPGGGSQYVLVDASTGVRSPAFDHTRVADSFSTTLGREVPPDRLPVDSMEWSTSGLLELHGAEGSWSLDLSTYEISPVEAADVGGLPFTLTPRPSTGSGAESQITFVNRLDQELQLFWLDGAAGRHFYSSIPPGSRHQQHTFAGHVWLVLGPEDEVVAVFEAAERPELAIIDGREPMETVPEEEVQDSAQGRDTEESGGSPGDPTPVGASGYEGPGTPSPDGRWVAFSRGDDLWLLDLSDGSERRLSNDGSPEYTYAKTNQRERFLEMEFDAATPPEGAVDVGWSPDSRHVFALRSVVVPERSVYLVESTPGDQVQPRLLSYPYLKPGDEVPVRRPHLFDVETGRETQIDDRLFPQPWGLYEFRWTPDGDRCFFLYNERGHRVMRVVEVEVATGRTRAIVEENPSTFFDYQGKTFLEHLDSTEELLWMSERDGWNHLYLYDRKRGEVKNQVTRGEWVVREVVEVDPESRRIWFRAMGILPGQDPYYVHYCRIDFDGKNLVVLTDGDGTHEVASSPDDRYLIDTWSRVDHPPVHTLRNAGSGALICELERADASEYLDAGRTFPEPFVAPGRDGLTPIYGVIHRPHDFDPAKPYPVIENIYAGPHGQHVPKSFRANYSLQTLANRGFIVVQIDGMGTNWRSKSFHDVCWQNLVDAGLPDRIAWIRAAAERYSYIDTTRVGIYGGSAGGQNALGALLTHGAFYKVAVADCGCHDNRMDKIWWNEQWMGYPVGPHYEAQSNVTLAPRLEGDLLLIVGELDRNVDPASTMQVVHALVEADKDFEMLVIPGVGHGAAGTQYGRRRLEEFFVRHLQP